MSIRAINIVFLSYYNDADISDSHCQILLPLVAHLNPLINIDPAKSDGYIVVTSLLLRSFYALESLGYVPEMHACIYNGSAADSL